MKLKLPLAKLIDITNALKSLHGQRKVIVDKEGKAVMQDGQIATEVIPFDLGAGVRLNVALMLMKLTPIVTAFEQTRDQVINKAKRDTTSEGSAMPEWGQGHPGFALAVAEMDKVLSEELELEFDAPIKVVDLKIDVNQFSPDLVIILSPILDFTAKA